MVEMSIPHLLRCPISLDLFTDPVTLFTGQTYDRPCIEKWLAAGNLTCPVTMQPLHDTSLVPNHTLRHLIEQWLAIGTAPDCSTNQSGASGPNPSLTRGMEFSLTALRCILQSGTATSDSKLHALNKVRLLSVESDVGRACLIQLGFIPLSLQLIFQSPLDRVHDKSKTELIELSLDCLLSLSPSTHLDSESLNRIMKQEINLSSLVLLLEQGCPPIKANLCSLLEMIATSAPTRELAVAIGLSPRVMQSLVSLLGNKSDTSASDASVRAMNGLCSIETNRTNAIREGAISGIIKYLSSNSNKGSASSHALSALESLLGLEIGKKTLVKVKNYIQVLVKHVFVVSSGNEGSEHAIAALMVMCLDSERARTEAVNAGVLTQLLFLIQSQCSLRAKTKARALLKFLRLMYKDYDYN